MEKIQYSKSLQPGSTSKLCPDPLGHLEGAISPSTCFQMF